jgi:hypothetical protein
VALARGIITRFESASALAPVLRANPGAGQTPITNPGTDKDTALQVFITASPVLRDRVRRAFRALQRGVAGTGHKDDEGGCPVRLADIAESAWPLFLTQGEWLRYGCIPSCATVSLPSFLFT